MDTQILLRLLTLCSAFNSRGDDLSDPPDAAERARARQAIQWVVNLVLARLDGGSQPITAKDTAFLVRGLDDMLSDSTPNALPDMGVKALWALRQDLAQRIGKRTNGDLALDVINDLAPAKSARSRAALAEKAIAAKNPDPPQPQAPPPLPPQPQPQPQPPAVTQEQRDLAGQVSGIIGGDNDVFRFVGNTLAAEAASAAQPRPVALDPTPPVSAAPAGAGGQQQRPPMPVPPGAAAAQKA